VSAGNFRDFFYRAGYCDKKCFRFSYVHWIWCSGEQSAFSAGTADC
jgi:hypothetical protein